MTTRDLKQSSVSTKEKVSEMGFAQGEPKQSPTKYRIRDGLSMATIVVATSCHSPSLLNATRNLTFSTPSLLWFVLYVTCGMLDLYYCSI